MRTIYKTLMVVLSVTACLIAVVGLAVSGGKHDPDPFQGNYEQHG